MQWYWAHDVIGCSGTGHMMSLDVVVLAYDVIGCSGTGTNGT